MDRYLSALLILAAINNSAKSSSDRPAATPNVCRECRCYHIKCSRIENPPENCRETYVDTCDDPAYIVEENDCNIRCDCCLAGQCLVWSNFHCVMFRSHSFFSMIYFIAIGVNLFILWRAYNSFFKVSRPRSSTDFEDPNTADKTFLKYSQTFWIMRHIESARVMLVDSGDKNAAVLFARIEEAKNLGKKNLAFVLGMIALYFILIAIEFFTLFFLLRYPFSYSYLIWVQHVLNIGFYVFVFVSRAKCPNYRNTINKLLDDFEEEYRCKIRIIKKFKLFEITWYHTASAPIDKKDEDRHIPTDNEDNNDSVDAIDAEKEPFNKVDVKEGKARLVNPKADLI